ncbi:hypothetical protein KFU94_60575 [Chloroflexi bacterium TSY]|nr:hypothetical protein [Chloroflexi bacterium TSY]
MGRLDRIRDYDEDNETFLEIEEDADGEAFDGTDLIGKGLSSLTNRRILHDETINTQ